MVRLPGRSGGGPARRPGGPRPPQTPDPAHTHAQHEGPLRGSSPTRVERDGARTRRRPGALRAVVGGRSVAGQVFVLQVMIVLLLVVAAVVALVLQVRHDSTIEARNRSVAVAEAFANAPGTVEALNSPDPSAVLQPRAEAARRATDVDFIVVMNTDGVRYTHPKPDRIGKKFVGTLAPALAGRTVTETIDGTIGPLVQAVVPVRADDGRVVGLVSAGITTANVGGAAN